VLRGHQLALALILSGAAVFAASHALITSGPPRQDERWFFAINQVPAGVGRILDRVARLFLPAGIAFAALATIAYVAAKTWRAEPVIYTLTAAGLSWALANAAKLAVHRSRPYLALPDAVLRQDPARGTSFPSSHAANSVAVLIVIAPFVPWPARIVGVGYLVGLAWSRVYLGVHYPLDLLGGVGVGMVAGGILRLIQEIMRE
jgi:undecaprenyl-diphosphatase